MNTYLANQMGTMYLAAKSSSVDLAQITKIMGSGVGILGAIILVFGLVNLGLTIKDGMQGGGGQLAGAIAMIVGGGIIIAASAYLSSLNTSL